MEISLASKFTGKEVVIPKNRQELLEKFEKLGEIVYTVVTSKGFQGYYLHGISKVIKASPLRISVTLKGKAIYRTIEIEFPECLVLIPLLRVHEQVFLMASELLGETVFDMFDYKLKYIYTDKVSVYGDTETINKHLGRLGKFVDSAEVLVQNATDMLEAVRLELTSEVSIETERLPEKVDVVFLFRIQEIKETVKEKYYTMFKTIIPVSLQS